MSQWFPDYARDASGFIPEPQCFDLLQILPEYGWGYLLDMNGCGIMVSCVVDVEKCPLDDEFEAWQAKYENTKMDENFDPIWNSEKDKREFDEEGLSLAHRLFDFFGGTKIIIYYFLDGHQIRLDTDTKPQIRIQ